MDRRERYDPEDIETLMQERSFDELLEEERAYVLRHVSGRAEYEAMRALLMQMRHVSQDHGTMEADPAIRGRIMQAFREQQRPQWSIWLNSVGAWLVPENAFAFWRPALAFASLALVIGTAVLLVQQAAAPQAELAEIRTKDPDRSSEIERKGAMQKEDPEQNLQELGDSGTASAGTAVEPATVAVTGAVLDAMVEIPFDKDRPADPRDDAAAEDLAESTKSEQAELFSDSEVIRPSHMVTEQELARNMSIANATGLIQAKGTQSREADRRSEAKPMSSMADRSELFELLATGW